MRLRWVIMEPRLIGGSLRLRTANCAALYTRPASFGTFFRAALLATSLYISEANPLSRNAREGTMRSPEIQKQNRAPPAREKGD